MKLVDLYEEMANHALSLAQLYAPKKTGEGASSIYPVYDENSFGLRAGKKYMYYQNFGTKPFFMTSLEGKVVPMMINGELIFRRVKGVGEHQITTRNALGQIEVGNRPYKWRNPGIKGSHFMERALDETVETYKQVIYRSLIVHLLEETTE